MQKTKVVGNKILEMTSIFFARKWNCSSQSNKYSWASFRPRKEETSTSDLLFPTESSKRGSCIESIFNYLINFSTIRLTQEYINVRCLTIVWEIDNSTNLSLSWSMIPSSISFFFSAFSLLFLCSSALVTLALLKVRNVFQFFIVINTEGCYNGYCHGKIIKNKKFHLTWVEWVEVRLCPFWRKLIWTATDIKCTIPGCVINKGVLHQRTEDEEDTHPSPDVHRLGVGHGRQGALDGGHRGGHGQECCHAQIYPSWGLREREKDYWCNWDC